MVDSVATHSQSGLRVWGKLPRYRQKMMQKLNHAIEIISQREPIVADLSFVPWESGNTPRRNGRRCGSPCYNANTDKNY